MNSNGLYFYFDDVLNHSPPIVQEWLLSGAKNCKLTPGEYMNVQDGLKSLSMSLDSMETNIMEFDKVPELFRKFCDDNSLKEITTFFVKVFGTTDINLVHEG